MTLLAQAAQSGDEAAEIVRRAIQAVLPRPPHPGLHMNLTAHIRKGECISVEISFRKDKAMKP